MLDAYDDRRAYWRALHWEGGLISAPAGGGSNPPATRHGIGAWISDNWRHPYTDQMLKSSRS